MNDNAMNEARRELTLRARHAFGHDRPGGSHHDANVQSFLRELERFIEAKFDAEMARLTNALNVKGKK